MWCCTHSLSLSHTHTHSLELDSLRQSRLKDKKGLCVCERESYLLACLPASHWLMVLFHICLCLSLFSLKTVFLFLCLMLETRKIILFDFHFHMFSIIFCHSLPLSASLCLSLSNVETQQEYLTSNSIRGFQCLPRFVPRFMPNSLSRNFYQVAHPSFLDLN